MSSTNGARAYQTLVSAALDEKIQQRAVELHKKGELKDEHGRIVDLRIDSKGHRHVSRYTVCKIALLRFANYGVKDGDRSL